MSSLLLSCTRTHLQYTCLITQVFSILAQRMAHAADEAAQAASEAELAFQQQKQQQDADMAAAAAAEAEAANNEQDGDQQQQQKVPPPQPDPQQQQQIVEAAAAARAEAARRLVLAQVQGFSMMFRSEVAALGLTQRLLDTVESCGLEQGMRAALLAPLGLA